jgi:hypothetical protein
MTKKSILLLLFLILTVSITRAGNLGMGVTTFSQDTLQYGDSLVIHTSVINFDSMPYYGLIDFYFELNGVRNLNTNIFPNPLSGVLISLGPGDSIPLTIVVYMSPAYFKTGPDIFVVWPIADGDSPPNNNSTHTIYIDYPLGLEDEGAPSKLKIRYQNQSILFEDESPEFPLNRVTIYNVMGQQVLDQAVNSAHSIPFDAPVGIYLVEVKALTRQSQVFKLVIY